ncbi:rod shape-determining protein [Hydrogenibacillus schlegelii]|uniref:Cell shape-determining protein MreB n=1 Tax=Hydrogenibacillus schlegelii TaxID=1484 RepID=A0A179IPF2_HYDSH|nr:MULTISPECIES: rod shape-determining protein [Hydrogenibacillus]MBT9282204.1 rod shape-determining protein [Hydrogenibacillus schlegelii]OAR04225.1 rod shape-determining protein MreB [Hydrogenibacillus schlegelii]PTQ54584.1 MAG: Rod shape-determining protein MreB [Hydrogenibacillus schlegelii]QZA32938.1 rod shape-determining protein [Hydrogenibacillus sp. N12]
MFAQDVGIDLGTANVLVFVRGRGIVLDEPTVVAMNVETGEVLAVGAEARHMIGRTPAHIQAVRPLKDGVIADFETTEKLLKYFLDKVGIRRFWQRPRMLMCVPSNTTTVEQKAIREAAEKSGAREVYIVEEPKAAAVGAGLDIFQPSGNMIIDIGGGTTDVAVLSLGDIVTAASIKVAGDKLDQALMSYLKRKHRLLVGERTVEALKIQIGAALPGLRSEAMDVRGRNVVTGLPETVRVTSDEVAEALDEPIREMIAAARSVLERTPPELSADIVDKGIVLTGGGALLYGLDRRFSEELHVPVVLADDPMRSVALGTGKMLEELDRLNRARGRRIGMGFRPFRP